MYCNDSLIVACGKESFNEIFINEKSWYPVAINIKKIDEIKFVFAYQKSPIAAITYVAEVKEIVNVEGTSKYKLIFKDTPKKIRKVPMGKDQRNVPQNPRYANSEVVVKALNMDCIFR